MNICVSEGKKMKRFNFRKNILMMVDVILIAISAFVSNSIVTLGCVVFNATQAQSELYIVNGIRILWIILLNALFCYFMLFICGAYNKAWRDFSKKDYLYCSVGVMAGLLLSGFFASLMISK